MREFHERFLMLLLDPEPVLLLFGIGMTGVVWEFARTGRIWPGVLGSACIVLALGSPAAKSFDGRGIGLVALSLLCFVLEGTFRARGLFACAGAFAMSLGLLLIEPRLGWPLASFCAVVSSLLLSFLFSVAFTARRNKLGILKKVQL